MNIIYTGKIFYIFSVIVSILNFINFLQIKNIFIKLNNFN